MNLIVERFVEIKDTNEKAEVLQQIKEIFFECANKKFSNDIEKEKFQNKWLDVYLTKKLHQYIYFIREGKKLIGYLTGCHCSQEFLSENNFFSREYNDFLEFVEMYPAHLHINLGPSARGKGIGPLLVNKFCEDLENLQSSGVHVITSPKSRNITFYEKNNFKMAVTSTCRKYLFMGRVLNKIG